MVERFIDIEKVKGSIPLSRTNLMEIKVIYETSDFLAVNKPAGLLMHPISGVKFQEPTLAGWLLQNYPEVKNVGDNSKVRPGIVHRLDKDTSGVIIVAKNQKYFEYLKNLFQKHQIKKKYLALVYGKLKSKKGIINKPISLKPGTTKRTVFGGKIKKEAITEYKVIKFLKSGEKFFSLVEVLPKTGRTHQIRIHLASIGHPIVGDSLYGPKKNVFDLDGQFLHAESLEFNLSDGRRIKIEADLPDDLKNILSGLTEY